MQRTRLADRVVCIATVVMLLAAVCLWGLVEPVRGDGSHTIGYEDLIFDQSRVHTLDITMENWDEFIANATSEEYAECNVVVDGEKYNNVAIRAKGNTSLSSVATLGSTRYSFKLEFDHYVKGMTYHGLDKLSLNNMIQDATMMKDYLAYTLMNRMGVASPLCSYVQINVNGEPWGLYLAVEGIENAFLDRNGMTKGELYKPDSMSFGGGRGNGQGFDFEQFRVEEEEEETSSQEATESTAPDTAESATSNESAASDTPQASSASDNPFAGSSGAPQGAGDGQSGMPQMPSGNFGPFGGTASTDGATDTQSGMPQMPSGNFDFSNMPSPPGNDGDSSRPSFNGNFSADFGGGFGMFNFGMGSSDVKLVYSDDDPDSYSNIFNNAKTNVTKKDKARLIASLKKLNAQEDLDSVVDKNEVITYLAVHNYLCNDDSYTGMMVHNYYLYEENGKLSILPWDYNLGFGGFSASSDATSIVNRPIDSPVSGGTTDSLPLIAWIFDDEKSLAAYHETYDRFITENIESGWLGEEILRVKAMILPYVEQDPSAFYSVEEFEKAVDTLNTFCMKRGQSIRSQLEGTIPSTSQGQQQDSSSLIDASEITISDMGSMNNGNNGGGPGGGSGGMPSGMPNFSGSGEGFTMPEGFSMPGGASAPESFTMPEGAPAPEGFTMPEGASAPEGFTMPQGFSQPPPQGGTNPFGDSAANVQSDSTQSAPDTSVAPNKSTTALTDSTVPAEKATASTDSAVSSEPTASSTETEATTAQSQSGTPTAGAPGGGGSRSGGPGGSFPGGGPGGGFPGGDFSSTSQGYQPGVWIQLAICAAALLVVMLIIRKVGSHNN